MVLVTGASGFLGQHLVRRLSAKGQMVRALYHSHPPSADLENLPGIEWMQADLLDIFDVEDAMKGIAQVYHCAAVVSFDPRRHEQMLHSNPESTANLVNQALLQGIDKMVFVSSIAALGRTGEEGKEINEDQEWGESRYNSVYGISKYLAETEVWRGIGEGMNAVIVNPGIILGECGRHGLAGQLMKVVYREFPFYSKGVNAWVDVGDVVSSIVKLMESDVNTERFIVSAGNYSYREIFQLMAAALGKKPPRFYAPPLLTGLGWRLARLKSLLSGSGNLITRETANNANSVSHYDNSKLLRALPDFSYLPVNETIERMARSFLED
jgi:nucleoside-diphosphate-sugar epimerase